MYIIIYSLLLYNIILGLFALFVAIQIFKKSYFFIPLYIILTLTIISSNTMDENLTMVVDNNLKVNDDYITFVGKTGLHKYKVTITSNNIKNTELRYGDIIELSDYESKEVTNSYNNPSSFNTKQYYLSKKITFDVKSIDYKLLRHKTNYKYMLANLRNKLIRYNNSRYSDISKFMNGIILGYKDFDDNAKEIISKTGTNHLFAISGSHLAVLIILLDVLIAIFNTNSKNHKIIKNIFLIIFYFLVGCTYPVARVVFIEVIYSMSNVSKTKEELLFIFIILCFILNPFVFLNIGFVLTIYISYIIPYILDYINNDPKLNKFKYFAFPYIIYISTLPLTINLSNNINIFSPIASIILGGFISFIGIPVSLFLMVTPFSFFIDNLLQYALLFISKVLYNLSYYSINVRSLHLFEIIILICLIFLYYKYNTKYIAYSYLFIIIIVIVNFNLRGEVSIIDIGQGDSIFIRYPYSGEVLLIDTGPEKSEKELIDFLKYKGVRTIDKVILTHNHSDHVANINAVNDNFNIKDIYMPITKDYTNKNVTFLESGDHININGNNIEILSPDSVSDNKNEESISFILELGNKKWFFGGDMEEVNEQVLIDKNYDLDVDYLKASHHGSNTSTSKMFLDYLDPKYVIISCGKNNMYHHPSNEVIELLKQEDIPYHITSEDGIFTKKFFGV